MYRLYLVFSLLAVISPVAAFTKIRLFRRRSGSCNQRQSQGCRSHYLFLKPEAPEEAENTHNIITGTFVVTSLLASTGVFWSEWAVLQTGCGPLYLPDWLERSCYLDALFVSGLSVFLQIVYRQGLSSWTAAPMKRAVQVCEVLAWLAIAGAVVVLVNQMLNGETMDGLSGIDFKKCKAKQAFATQLME